MATFKVIYDLEQAWEEWLVEVPDDVAEEMTEENELQLIQENGEFVSLLDAGNSMMEATEVQAMVD